MEGIVVVGGRVEEHGMAIRVASRGGSTSSSRSLPSTAVSVRTYGDGSGSARGGGGGEGGRRGVRVIGGTLARAEHFIQALLDAPTSSIASSGRPVVRKCRGEMWEAALPVEELTKAFPEVKWGRTRVYLGKYKSRSDAEVAVREAVVGLIVPRTPATPITTTLPSFPPAHLPFATSTPLHPITAITTKTPTHFQLKFSSSLFTVRPISPTELQITISTPPPSSPPPPSPPSPPRPSHHPPPTSSPILPGAVEVGIGIGEGVERKVGKERVDVIEEEEEVEEEVVCGYVRREGGVEYQAMVVVRKGEDVVLPSAPTLRQKKGERRKGKGRVGVGLRGEEGGVLWFSERSVVVPPARQEDGMVCVLSDRVAEQGMEGAIGRKRKSDETEVEVEVQAAVPRQGGIARWWPFSPKEAREMEEEGVVSVTVLQPTTTEEGQKGVLLSPPLSPLAAAGFLGAMCFWNGEM